MLPLSPSPSFLPHSSLLLLPPSLFPHPSSLTLSLPHSLTHTFPVKHTRTQPLPLSPLPPTKKIKHTHTCSISLETRWMQSGKSLTCAFLRPRSKILILASGTARTNRERGYGLFLQYLVGIAQRPVKSLVVSATAVLRASCSVQTKPAQTRASTLPQNNASKTNL